MARPRKPGPLTRAALAAAVVALTWWTSGLLIQRHAATRLPVLTGTALPAPVAADVAAAEAAARRAPTDAGAVGALGMAYHGALRPDEALQAYALAASLDDEDWRWTYYRGLLLIERGAHEEAEAALTAVVALAGRHELAQFHLGELAFKRGRLDAAAAAYGAACDAPETPRRPPAPPGTPARRGLPLAAHCAFGLARVAIERGDLDAARRRLEALVNAHPQFGPARTLLRQVGHAGEITDARASVPPVDPWLDQVVARSRHTDLLLKHASLALRGGDREWREWLARRALEASPDSLDTLLEMASAHQDAARHEEALALLQRAEAAAPGDHHVLVEMGQSLIALDRLTDAERVLRRATRVRDATAEYNLATALDAMDRWEDARDHYERALEINPFHARALNNLGTGFARRGRHADALAAYQRAIAAAPAEPESYANAAGLLTEMRRFDEALAMVDTAVALDPRHANAHDTRGIILAMTGRAAEARTAFETALRLDPSHAGARRNLAALNQQR